MRIVGFVGSRTEPHVVVELGGDLHLFELGLPHPEELPVETGMLADSHLQRPTEHAAVDELLDLVDSRVHAVKRIGEAEPSIQTENIAVTLHGLLNPLALADGARHRFLAPDILTGRGGLHRHDAVPVRRRSDMYDIDVRIGDQLTIVGIGCHFLAGQLPSGLQMILVDVADRDQTRTRVSVMASAHAAYADDTFGQLVARSRVADAAQNMTRDDGQRGHAGERFQEFPSLHNRLTFIYISISLDSIFLQINAFRKEIVWHPVKNQSFR